MRVEFSVRNSAQATAVFSLLLLAAPFVRALQASDSAQVPAATEPAPRIALVVFAQHRLPESSWTALFAALRANLPEVAAEFPALGVNLDASPELIRGDRLPFAAPTPQGVVVYLRGDCRPPLLPASFPSGEALGWVLQSGAHIESVIHVECSEIGKELSKRTNRMSQDQRTAAMSEAMARVILHEWVHIATQSAAHEKEGIGKAGFGVNDLLSPEQGIGRTGVGASKEDAARAGAGPGGSQ